MASGTNGENRSSAEPHIIVRNLTMAYGSFVLMRELNFVVKRGDIFIIIWAAADAAKAGCSVI